MAICDADLRHLKPGKTVALKSFNGSKIAPADVNPASNYWRLIGAKAVVVTTSADNSCAFLRFDRDLTALGLIVHNDTKNSLWILVSDLKFVCRY